MKTIGFIVMESCDDYEQALVLSTSKELPPGGVLEWATISKRNPRAMFASKSDATSAINRTEHYRLAFGKSLPEKRYCSVVPVCQIATQGAQEGTP